MAALRSIGKDANRLPIEREYYASRLGLLAIYADQAGITKIEFAGDIFGSGQGPSARDRDDAISSNLEDVSLGGSFSRSDNKHIVACIRWLHQYFSDPSKLSDVEAPILNMNSHQSRPFLVKVWQILHQRTTPGETVTYGKLASLAGNPNAGRSVGLAMRRNPFPIIVPCHRVIRSNAKIGNYSWLNGVSTKKWLLDHEKTVKQKYNS